MAKFGSQTPVRNNSWGVIQSTPTQVLNHEGVPAFSRDAKSELFLLGVTNFVSEDTYYETGEQRDTRYANLVAQVTQTDPVWVAHFAVYLRSVVNMRSVAVVTACEYAKAGGPEARKVVNAVCQRADEPGEVLAYWINKYGRPVPSSVKRGVADAARRLYTERNQIKWDTSSHNWRWADVINMARPRPFSRIEQIERLAKQRVHATIEKPTRADFVRAEQEINVENREGRLFIPDQNYLFGYCLDSRYDNSAFFHGEKLPMLGKRRDLLALPKDKARALLLAEPERLAEAGMTWEALSSFGPMDKAAWEAVIPSMGYMALLRNLRNFDQAGVSDKVADQIIAKLTDPEEVAKSRQLPFRFYSAYNAAPSLRWSYPLEKALDLSLSNIEPFRGRTLVLVDTSGSMEGFGYSAKGTVEPIHLAALFGSALTRTGDVDVRIFGNYSESFEFDKASSVLKTMESLLDVVGTVGHGTNIPEAFTHWNGHDRIIILSDMQTTHYMGDAIPSGVPVYAFNLKDQGQTIADPAKRIYEIGGVTDNTFKMINALETGHKAQWPWDQK